MKTNWSKDELKTYLLIYCANANFEEKKSEVKYIKSQIRSADFDKIHAEFEQDNDYDGIQKIQSAIEDHGYDKKDIKHLLQEMKQLFLVDDHFDILERNLMKSLKRILK